MNPLGPRVREVAERLLLSALLVIPFLVPVHTRPIPSFWSEGWAAVLGLGLAAVVLVSRRDGPLQLPHVVLLPTVLAASLGLQFMLGRIHVPELALLRLAYLFWAALLALAGRSLAERHGLQWIADCAAPALLAGALANALLALLQANSIQLPAILMFHHPQGIPGGNLAQPNHLNHQLWLGLASLIHLHARQRLPMATAVPAVLLLLLASAATASRSVLIDALALMALAWAFRSWQPDDAWRQRLWRAATATAIMTAVMLLAHHYAIREGWLRLSGLPTGIDRFFMDGGGLDSRLQIWARAWKIFIAYPWLGAGVGELPRLNGVVAQTFSITDGSGVVEHSHNLLLQWLAESGIVATIICLVLLWRWVRNLQLEESSLATWWICAVLSIAGIHSLLEYPLWYAYFLGPVMLLLGAGDFGIHKPGWSIPRIAMTFAMTIGVVFLFKLAGDYRVLEKWINPWLVSPVLNLTESLSAPDLIRLHDLSLLAPYVDFAQASQLPPDGPESDERRAVCDRALWFYPQAAIVRNCAK